MISDVQQMVQYQRGDTMRYGRIQPVLAVISACVCLAALGCSETQTEPQMPQGESGIYSLSLRADQDTIWSGGVIQFTAVPEKLPPEGCEYRWEWYYGYHENARMLTSNSPTLSVQFDDYGYVTISVSLYLHNELLQEYRSEQYRVTVRRATGRLSIKPETAFWDIGENIYYSAVFEGVAPPNSVIQWHFDDGVSMEAPISQPVSHSYEKVGTYHPEARLYLPVMDSVIAVGEGVITVTPPTPGRYLSVKIRDLLRTYEKQQYGYERYFDKSLIETDFTDYHLRWDGDAFSMYHEYKRVPHWMVTWSFRCIGAIKDGRIDSLRIEEKAGYPVYRDLCYTLRDIGPSAFHSDEWECIGSECAEKLVQIEETRYIYNQYGGWGEKLVRTQFSSHARITVRISNTK